jgi:hypothetical protein
VDSPWPFRDSKVLLLILLGRGRHIEGGVGFTVDADGVYMVSQGKGVGYPRGTQRNRNPESRQVRDPVKD